ncbi:anti-sigma factor domain-containing protein [Desulfitobacterium chlororespirans]|uniref:Anti-sigma factor N-terminus n=1 Tax=Desulfitobacterium chlororespirans DSM 11544 TaxID=1121395 RepID=A0A1M7TCD1_9FIRM|nr:anti-sigma factor domain-containing protein [Desulfitobacterium chlororespirans]SHN68327.1 Anti-sigma factor N-terminus [Desulfitobacterium chlororespirans DSM 11544]
MSQIKAVVLEKHKNSITVLTGDGAFQTLKYKGDAEVGEEIQLPIQSRATFWRIGASAAAVVLLALMGIFGWNAWQPRTAVAMISLDINPSLQLTVDQKGEVLELESLNSEAEQLVTGLALKGKSWGEALNEIIQKSVALNYLNEEENWVVVGYSSSATDQKEPPAKVSVINTEAITKQVQQAVHEQGLKSTVAVYELTSEQKKQAQETGLTLGEYALADTAQKAGIKVEPKDLKAKEERTRLLETPEIQEQMRKDKLIIEAMSNKTNQGEGKDKKEGYAKSKWYNLDREKNNQKNTKEQPRNGISTPKPSQDSNRSTNKDNNKDSNKNSNKDRSKDKDKDRDYGSGTKGKGTDKGDDLEKGEDNRSDNQGNSGRNNDQNTDKEKRGQKKGAPDSDQKQSPKQDEPAEKAGKKDNQDTKQNSNRKTEGDSRNSSQNKWSFGNFLRMNYSQRT